MPIRISENGNVVPIYNFYVRSSDIKNDYDLNVLLPSLSDREDNMSIKRYELLNIW
ncbi:MAG TPA: hypothetical protein VLZ83_15215 [Edaphocola sp.]|nr:hypothetical protein [Edaphocola sp.]